MDNQQWDGKNEYPILINKHGIEKRTVVYLSGPITGLPEENKPAFDEYAHSLRVKGYDVVSPHEMHLTPGAEKTRENYMRRDIGVIIAEGTIHEIDVLAMMPGWKASSGAICEKLIGEQLNKPILSADTMLSMTDRYVLPGVIALNGYICSGKDFVASALVEQGYLALSFADALKNMVAENNGVTREYLDAHKVDFRDQLQEVGAAKRAENPNYWVDRVLEKLDGFKGYQRVVITDCRHPNEAMAIHHYGGFVVKVVTPLQERQRRAEALYGGISLKQQQHESETAQTRAMFHAMLPGTLEKGYILSELEHVYSLWHAAGKPMFVDYAGLEEMQMQKDFILNGVTCDA